MGILAWLILGALAGWLASKVMNTDEQQGALANIVVGILGAIIGGYVFNLFGGESVTGLNLYSVFVAFVGAVVLLFLYKTVTRKKS